MNWRPDLAVGFAGTALGIAALIAIPYQIRGQGYDAIADIQSPAFFPILIALLMIGVSAVLLFVRLCYPPAPEGAASDRIQPEGETGRVAMPQRLIATAFCLITYYLALEIVGMVPASIALIVVLSLVLGFRRYALLGIVALLIPTAIYYSFEKGLYVLLPAGALF